MMNDKDYAELKLRAMIIPKQASWPEYGYWQRLHEVVNEARERVSKILHIGGRDRSQRQSFPRRQRPPAQ